jgi:hypothetical protein
MLHAIRDSAQWRKFRIPVPVGDLLFCGAAAAALGKALPPMGRQVAPVGYLGTILPDFGRAYLDPEDKVREL